MKTVYLDSAYMCHLNDDGTMIRVDTDIFNAVVDAAIPFYRLIPTGHVWTDDAGNNYHGPFTQATDTVSIDRVTQESKMIDMHQALTIMLGGDV